jgi:hypothetical protein
LVQPLFDGTQGITSFERALGWRKGSWRNLQLGAR